MKTPLAATLLLALALAVPLTAGATAADGPSATAAKSCKSINTKNGGRAEVIRTNGKGLSCRTARRVAKQARGKATYKARGFDCKGTKLRSGEYRRLYGCGRYIDGKAQGIGFFWKKR
jgi:hypothetical protein